MVTSRIWFTAAQKAELWERWKNGQSAAAISRALERKNKTGVERIVVLHGGIGPAPRRRALAALRFEEREEISRGIAVGRSIRQIAQGLGRAPSTVSREIRRNGGSQAYRANWADRRARDRAWRPKPCRLSLCSELRWRVAQKLALQWSPEQISGWLKRELPTDQDMQISPKRSIPACSFRYAATQPSGSTPKRPNHGNGAGPHPRYGLDPRAARRGRGSCRAGPLGGDLL